MTNFKSSATEGDPSGIFGNRVFLKAHRNRTELTIPRKRKNGDPSDAQLIVRNNFKRGAGYSTTVHKDPVLAALYKSKAGKGVSSYTLALTDFLRPPVVDRIDTRNYAGQAGDRILVEAHDVVEVTEVKLVISDASGELVERGNCTLNPRIGYWEYTATTPVASTAGLTITATAYDIPNHPTERSVTL